MGSLKEVEGYNGFANRFLWLCVKRSKLLPGGGKDVDLSACTSRLMDILLFAETVGEMHRDIEATKYWAELTGRWRTVLPACMGQ